MENENKWEYDYSASNNETGYPNVGSSGMNTANQYNEPEAQPARPADTAPADGGSVPPSRSSRSTAPRSSRKSPAARRNSMAKSWHAAPWRWCWQQPWALRAALWVQNTAAAAR